MDRSVRSERRTRVRPLVALVAGTGLALAGCGGDTTPASAAPAPAPTTSGGDGGTRGAPAGPEAVAWTGTVCEALVPVIGYLRTPPSIDVTDPAAAQRGYATYLQAAENKAEEAQQRVAAAGPAPVTGGDELAQDVREQVADLREDVVEARRQVDAADPSNPVAVGQAVAVGGNVLGALGNNVQAVGALVADSEIHDAFQQAPACRDLRAVGNPS